MCICGATHKLVVFSLSAYPFQEALGVGSKRDGRLASWKVLTYLARTPVRRYQPINVPTEGSGGAS